MDKYLSSKQLAERALEALAGDKDSPEQTFARLIEWGFIDSRGRVTKLLGGTAEPEQTAKRRNGRGHGRKGQKPSSTSDD
jgi:hypothetical protein